MGIDMVDLDTFLLKVLPEPNTGCWIWLPKSHIKNYGVLKVKGKQFYAHRLSWELHFGKIPDGKLICHKCDNPACVNPRHLFVGTHYDNQWDAFRKGRRQWLNPYHGKLTREQILEIRQKPDLLRVLAKQYNVTEATISRVQNLKVWNQI